MAIAKFGERNSTNTDWDYVFDILYVYELDDSFEFVGDRARTAGGIMRQDVVGNKRHWRLSTRRMTRSEAYDLINYLRDNYFAVGDFWVDEFGAESSTISAYIIPESIRANRVTFRRDGAFHNDGRELTMEIVER